MLFSVLPMFFRSWRLSLAVRSLGSVGCSVEQLAGVALNAEQLQYLVEDAKTPRKPQHTSRRPPTSRALGDGTGTWRCCDCGDEKTLADFYVRATGCMRSYCKKCHNERVADYRRTLRGNVAVLLSNARKRSKVKGLACSLDPDFILNTILRQKGRCAYSGVQMEVLLPHSDWRMSLERLDNAVGYVPENCVLIAAEFNSTEKISRRVPSDPNVRIFQVVPAESSERSELVATVER
ncbi:unnamed protein product [Durusdinium trenchii]|uniref:Uncharacterized protein n=1 Tax=Durusdinium trenchii TaxID=1381693 RepID=A0ABP0PK72_9DINO